MRNKKPKQAHLWERDPNDWYVEPFECSAALFAMERFEGAIWDPACGSGRIVQEARRAGLQAKGSDLIQRSEFCEVTSDFLAGTPRTKSANIVSNPPFGIAEEFVHRALALVRTNGKVAMLLPLVWMAGFSTKRDWLPSSPLRRVYPISPRPSMPPGAVIEAGVRPGNGTKDFAWFVWQNRYVGAPEIVFMNTSQYKLRDRFGEQDHARRSKRDIADVG